MLALATVLVGSAAMTGCTPADAGALEDVVWMLRSYGEPGNLKPVLEGTTPNATFEGTETRVTGDTSCNHFQGSYEVGGDTLSVGPIAQTERACVDPAGAMEQERDFMTLLGQARTWEIIGDELRITSTTGVMVFVAE
jgi:heat shock protein HslJ